MKKNIKITKASKALVLAAFVLLAAGGAIATFAAPEIISEDYKAEFALDHLGIRLVENGVVSDDIESGKLINPLGGKVDPGRVYKEELAAKNITDVDEYTRMFIRVYWLDKDGNKDSSMDPSLIELTYDDQDYNSGAWQINPDETTTECRVFYYSKIHKAGETTEPVVNKLRLNGKVMDDVTVTSERKGNKTIYTYVYKYDGYSIAIEADCQSLQIHNVNDAIKSVWGVDNVTVSDEVLTVG